MVFLQFLMGFLRLSSLSLITELSPWELSLSLIVLSKTAILTNKKVPRTTTPKNGPQSFHYIYQMTMQTTYS